MASGKTMDDVFELTGKRLEGKYDVASVVARGGFGVVYKARHHALNKSVALKVLSVPDGGPGSESAAKFLEAFAREAQIVARLDHPAVVKVLDFGALSRPDTGKVPWMVMDWVEGETLSRHLARRRNHGGRSPMECLALLRPVLEALAEAHEQGIAHRDIKPANLMVVDPGILAGQSRPTRRGSPPLRLLDFGIAKVMSPDEKAGTGQTWTERNVGGLSPHYAAPEQFARTRSGPWTDVHALGLILSEMLADAPPYGGRRDEELLQVVFSNDRPTPAQLGVDAGPWEPVIARALAIKPADRYQNAAELLHALEQSLAIEMTTPWRKPALVPSSLPPAATQSVPPEGSVEVSAPDIAAEAPHSIPSAPSGSYSFPSTLTPSEIPTASVPLAPRPARLLAPALASLAAAAGLFVLAFVITSTPSRRPHSPAAHATNAPAALPTSPAALPTSPAALPASPAALPTSPAALPTSPAALPTSPAALPTSPPAHPTSPPLVPSAHALPPRAPTAPVRPPAAPTMFDTTVPPAVRPIPSRPARRPHRPEEDHVPTE